MAISAKLKAAEFRPASGSGQLERLVTWTADVGGSHVSGYALGVAPGVVLKREKKRRRRSTHAEEMSLNRRSSTLPLALPQIRARTIPQIDKSSNLPLSPLSNTLPPVSSCLGL